jgi:hypothetical protein
MISLLVETEAQTKIHKAGFGLRRALLSTMLLVPLALMWGCAGVASSHTSQPSSQTFGISGTISPAAGGSGTTVALSGATAATTTADTSGNYTFTGLANGTYAVTPTNRGFAYSPTSQNATVNGANISGVNFTATPQQVHSVALSWNASTSTVSAYNIYRSTLSGGSYLRINSLPVAGLSYTDSTVQNTVTYYYVTTAVDANGVESSFSNQASAVIP